MRNSLSTHTRSFGLWRGGLQSFSHTSVKSPEPLYSSSLTFCLASPAVCLAASEPALTCSKIQFHVLWSVSLSLAKTVSDGELVPYRK